MQANDTSSDDRQEPSVNASSDSRRERSTIEFPYMDLSTALEVARGVYERNGSADCQLDELAAQLGLSPASSGFRTRLSAARIFGLLNSARGSDYVNLTELGLQAVDPATSRKAKADAFLRVELFAKIYEEFKGRQLPPDSALQRQMERFGVASKQTDRARQILERSADSAGFFESGRDRLVRPAGLGNEPGVNRQPSLGSGQTTKESPSTGKDDDGVDPIIKGLLQRLPKSGAIWPKEERKLWLMLLENSFQLIYKDHKHSETDKDVEVQANPRDT